MINSAKQPSSIYKIFTRILVTAVMVAISGCSVTGTPTKALSSPTPTPEATSTTVPTADSPTPTATPQYLVPTETLRGIPIIFAHPWTGRAADIVDSLVEAFNQTNEWGIRVSARPTGSSMALAEIIETGRVDEYYPQVVAAPSEHLLTWLDQENRLRPLNDFIADPAYGLDDHQRTEFPLVFWQQDQTQGTQAGIPLQRDMQVLYYNQTWAEELGFTSAPSTVTDFKEQACAASFVNSHDPFLANDGTGGWMINTDGLVVYSWLKVFGLENPVSTEPPSYHFNQPAAEQAFTFLRGMADESCAWFARTTSSNEYFANRQALMYSGSLSDLPLQARTMTRMGSGDSWTIIPFPDGATSTLVASGLSLGVMRGTAGQEMASWLFVRWMSLPENNARILTAVGGLPVQNSVISLVEGQMGDVPHWNEAIKWIPAVQSAPADKGWRVARFILQDAFWQAMQSFTPIENLPLLLEQVDATILEVQSVRGD